MPRMYCSHIGLLYSFYEILAARGGDVYEPSYFRVFQLSPLVIFKRSSQPNVELREREMADEFCHVTFRHLLHAVNLRHGTDGFTSPPKEGLTNPTASVGFEPANLGTKGLERYL